jgi:hypothetical protein
MNGDTSAPQHVNQFPDDSNNQDNELHGYYFLLPKIRVKQNKKGVDPRTLCAFGPYRSSLEARFINTSALALGLLDSDAAR